MRASAVLVAGAAITACSAGPAPAPPSARISPTSPAPTSTRPSTRASYGANGTHFPVDLNWPGEQAALEFEAECTWTDIARRVQGLTAAEVAAGVIIRVLPGTLPGGGGQSSSPAVMTQVGNQNWTRNVLIVPRDGFGSVLVSPEGIRIDECARLSFFGFLSEGSFTLTRCVDLQMGWSRWSGAGVTRGARNIAFYELILGFRRGQDDTAGFRPIETFEMTGLERHGCVFGPSVKPEGDSAHIDTVQLEGTGTGPFGGYDNTDCVDFGSSNSVNVLHTRLSYASFAHCMILGGQLPWTVYPLAAGDYQGDPNAFAGGCLDVRLSDSIVVGPIGSLGYTSVTDTRLSYQPVESQAPSGSGAWTVDPSIASWGRADIMSMQEIPDYETSTLTALWAW